MQALYGKKSSEDGNNVIKNTVEKEEEEEDRNNELCKNAKVDAMVTTKDKTTYAFKGSKYWRLTDDGVAKGYPRSISRDWDGLPSNLDAAFTWTNGRTYFFRGSKYWRFTNQEMDKGYPKPISKGFDGIPNFVDAAFVWSGNGKIYFFKVIFSTIDKPFLVSYYIRFHQHPNSNKPAFFILG